MARIKFRRLAAAAAVAAAFAFPAQEAQAVPVVIAAIGATIAGTTFAAGVFTLGFSIGTFAASLAMSAISGLLAKSPDQTQPSFQTEAQGRTVVVRSAVATRRVVYGQSVVSGPLVFADTTTVGGKLYHHYVIPLAAHESQEIGDIYFNDELVGTLDGSGNVTSGTFSGYARIKKHLGATDQVADTDLVAECPDLWTSNHRLRGITYIYVRLHINGGAFPNGIPNIKAVVKGRKLYDPRVPGSPTVTAWSDNWALIVRDYLSSAYGLGCTDAEIDDTAIVAAANIADELVVTAAGSPSPTQARYTANGTVDLGNRPREIMAQLLTAGAGACIYAQGVYRVLAGAYASPAVAIDADWLAGGVKVRPRMARQDLYNAVRGTYSDPDKQWQATDFPPQTNSTYEAQDGGLRIPRDIELPFTTDPMAAQRIAKIHLEKGRTSISAQMTCNLKAFQVRVWDTVTVTLSTLGWSSKVFLVTGWALNERGTIDLQLQEELAASYTWAYTDATVLATPASSACPTTHATFDSAAKTSGLSLRSCSTYAYAPASDNAWMEVLSTVFQVVGGSPTVKKYCEFTKSGSVGSYNFGLAPSGYSTVYYNYLGATADSYSYGTVSGGGAGPTYAVNAATPTAYGSTPADDDVIGMLFDAGAGTLSFTLNGVDQGVAFTGITGTFCPAASLSDRIIITCNFGADAWAYAPPAGYTGWTV